MRKIAYESVKNIIATGRDPEAEENSNQNRNSSERITTQFQ